MPTRRSTASHPIRIPVVLFLLCLLHLPALAQHEITMRDGARVEGKILSSAGEALRVQVYVRSRGEYSEVAVAKKDVARVYDVVADRDVTSTFVGGGAVESDAASGTKVDRPPSDANGDLIPIRWNGSKPQAERRMPERGAVRDGYQGEIGASLQYLHLIDGSGPGSDQRGFGVDFGYSFHPVVHDRAHPTKVSKALIPKGFIAAQLAVGPTYTDGPDKLTGRAFGAGLVSPTIALGGGLLLDRSKAELSEWYEGRLYTQTLSVNETAFGAFIDIFASDAIVLRELIGFGSMGFEYEITDMFGDSYTEDESKSTFRIEHTMGVRGGRSFGYSHELYYVSVADVFERVNFNHYFEVATSETFALEPQLRIQALIDNGGDTDYLVGIGAGLNFTFNAKVVLQLLPLYLADPDNPDNRTASGQARLGVRF